MATELKRLDFTANSFTGLSGKKYIIHNSLSVARNRVRGELEVAAATGSDSQTIFNTYRTSFDAINAPGGARVGEVAVTLHNGMMGMARNLEYREHPILLLCTLWISAEGEDLAKWTEAEANEKIADWNEYDVMDFFALALAWCPGLRNALNYAFLNTTPSRGELMEMQEAN